MVVKNINLLNKKGYIEENMYIAMNLKERGITVGDLIILLIIIITSAIFIRTFNKGKKTTLHDRNYEKITYQTSYYYQKLI
jgi:hypothetical protein